MQNHRYSPISEDSSLTSSLSNDLLQLPSLYKLNPNLIDDHALPPPDSLFPATVSNNPIPPVVPVNSEQFVAIINSVKEAINNGIYPTRISKGSSGSYFCYNMEREIVGVFKPKNEEPYGHLNPKWTKWLHRNLLPCCFGRSCIIPNLGYISEAAASYVDRRLGLNIVPRTEIVYLSSPSFHYSFKERWSNRIFGTPVKPKIGSFQLFLNGFVDSTTVFQEAYSKLSRNSVSSVTEQHPLGWSEAGQQSFQLGFERLVILDYFIRNTDRGSDNWMLKTSHNSLTASSSVSSFSDHQHLSQINSQSLLIPVTDNGPAVPQQTNIMFDHMRHENLNNSQFVQIAAIDNGLAFPTHHPNSVRSYPYGWTNLEIVYIPFSRSTSDNLLPYLTSPSWVEGTLGGLETLFSIDSDFKPKMWQKQKSVIRGQITNISDILTRARSEAVSPFNLVKKPLILIYEEREETEEGSMGSVRHRLETFTGRTCFTSC
ncbi:phosphatidylinositol 3 and 4-kinase-domain-containing protein [Globomyces pollinis-pini]|nr:phosphatidylinositol 3 and 4-kinase-domain-containing protein [Globomyces pollinis-pini]